MPRDVVSAQLGVIGPLVSSFQSPRGNGGVKTLSKELKESTGQYV